MKNKTIYTPVEPDKDEKDANSPNNREEEEETEYPHGKHPNSLKALKKNQYPKGFSGNVLGKPFKFKSLSEQLKELGDEETFNYENESLGSRKEQVLKRIWFDAIRGDMKKIQLLAWLRCLDQTERKK